MAPSLRLKLEVLEREKREGADPGEFRVLANKG